jgi:hypothetical protein
VYFRTVSPTAAAGDVKHVFDDIRYAANFADAIREAAKDQLPEKAPAGAETRKENGRVAPLFVPRACAPWLEISLAPSGAASGFAIA